MSNLNQVLAELANKGYKINKISKIKGGVNSETYKLISNQNKYVLKIYKK